MTLDPGIVLSTYTSAVPSRNPPKDFALSERKGDTLPETRAGPGLRVSVLECGDEARLAGVITALAGGAGCDSAIRSSCGISMPTRKAATPLLCVAALQNLAEARAGPGLRVSVLECGDGSRLAGVITALGGGAGCVSAIRSRSGDVTVHEESGDSVTLRRRTPKPGGSSCGPGTARERLGVRR